jgi:hypothetical protein
MRGRLTSIADLPMSESTRRRNPGLHVTGAGVSPFVASLAAEQGTKRDRLRQSKKPLLNSNETAFLAHLQATMPGAHIHAQELHLGLANGVRYTPDFLTFEPFSGRLCFWEVKGTRKIFDGAGEKLKIAAAKYRWAVFTLVWREDGEWQQQRILP